MWATNKGVEDLATRLVNVYARRLKLSKQQDEAWQRSLDEYTLIMVCLGKVTALAGIYKVPIHSAHNATHASVMLAR